MLSRTTFLTAFMAMWIVQACSPAYTRYISSYRANPGPAAPDYSNLFYWQAHLRAYYTTDTARALAAFELAYQDIKTAFQYYLDHYNNGRPIIIASHSQGSSHAQRLLKEFFENGPLKNRLVAAYVIGMYIP